MAIFDWFKQPASNAMLDNSFRNNFYQTNVQPVQSGATNIRPTNWQALRNWTPWKAFMPQSMGGTFHTGGTPQALSALSKAKNVGVGAARTVFGIPGLVASTPPPTPASSLHHHSPPLSSHPPPRSLPAVCFTSVCFTSVRFTSVCFTSVRFTSVRFTSVRFTSVCFT